MSSIRDRNQLLFDSKNLRTSENSSGVPLWFLFFTCLTLLGVAGFSYTLGDNPAAFDSFSSENLETQENYSIGEFEIFFVSPSEEPKMQGNNGFTYTNRYGDIWINKHFLENRNWAGLKVTCNHELLHNIGIKKEKHHEMVHRFDSQISSEVCNKLVEKVRR